MVWLLSDVLLINILLYFSIILVCNYNLTICNHTAFWGHQETSVLQMSAEMFNLALATSAPRPMAI